MMIHQQQVCVSTVILCFLLVAMLQVQLVVSCPAISSNERCIHIKHWNELKILANLGWQRIVLCPFTLEAEFPITIINSVQIICQRRGACRIAGEGTHLKIESSDVTLSGFAFAGATESAITVGDTVTNFKVCESNFKNNYGNSGGAIRASAFSEVKVFGSTFDSNSADDFGGHIFSVMSSKLYVGGSQFFNGSARFGGAIYSYFQSEVWVAESSFHQNTARLASPCIGTFFSESTDQSGNIGVDNTDQNDFVCNGFYDENTQTCMKFKKTPRNAIAAPTKKEENTAIVVTKSPTRSPTRSPTKSPTRSPTKSPVRSITRSPTKSPTKSPTTSPTKRPTISPTPSPTISIKKEKDVDRHGIINLYKSCETSCGQDWESKWENHRMSLTRAGQKDPFDRRTSFRGRRSGHISTGAGSEILTLKKSPRFYISEPNLGFGDVEFTTYFRLPSSFKADRFFSGVSLVTRSDHHGYKEDPCNAAGYMARFWYSDGSVSFEKEYYHKDSKPSVLRYGFSRRRRHFEEFPTDQWIGIKFVVYTIPGMDKVKLELFLDMTNGRDGGEWKMIHSLVDSFGSWTPWEPLPERCSIGEFDPILRRGRVSFLRMDGSEAQFKKTSIRHIVPELIQELI